MKRYFSIILAAVLLFTVTSCKSPSEIFDLSQIEITENGSLKDVLEKVASADEIGENADGEEEKLTGEQEKSLYCYSDLNDNQKHMYKVMLHAAKNMTQGFISFGKKYDDYRRDISVCYHALNNDYPEIFWLPDSYYVSEKAGKTAFAFSKSDSENDYLILKNELDRYKEDLDTAVEMFTDIASKGETDFDKELLLHDEMCKRITYDSEGEEQIYTSYGALVNGRAVCEGYSRAFMLVMNKLGIKTICVSGNSKGIGHMWNMVMLDGEWYHIDVTWDDLQTNVLHTYFNLTEKSVLVDHDIDINWDKADKNKLISGESYNYSLPKATATEKNYFEYSGLVLDSFDVDYIAQKIIETDKKDIKCLQIKLTLNDVYNDVRENLSVYAVNVQREINAHDKKTKIKLQTAAFTDTTIIFYWKAD